MAIVTGKTSEKIDQLINNLIAAGSINDAGQLTLTKGDGSTINAGTVGSSIVTATINAASRLIFTRRDGSTFDAGQVSKALDSYPVGSIFMSVSPTNPGSIFGGTWSAWGQGHFPVSIDSTQAEFDTVEETGGSKLQTLTTNEMPAHSHTGTAAGAGSHSHNTTTWGHSYGYGQGTINVSRHTPSGAENTYNMASDTEPAHSHSVTTIAQGLGKPYLNLPPYITCYMWKRTA